MSESYIEFLSRGDSLNPIQSTVSEALPNLFHDCIKYSLYFIFVCLISPRLVKIMFPKFYNDLDDLKKTELTSFLCGLSHHMIIAPYGFYQIYLDYYRTKDEYSNMNYGETHANGVLFVLPIIFGYLIGDTIFFTLNEIMQGRYLYFLHHISSFVLFYGLLDARNAVIRFIPFYLICESSNLFFTLAWFLRAAGFKNSPCMIYIEMSFAITFFLTRIISLPLSNYFLFLLPSAESFGPFKLVVIPVVLLQFYWFHKIVSIIFEKLSGNYEKNKELKKELKKN